MRTKRVILIPAANEAMLDAANEPGGGVFALVSGNEIVIPFGEYPHKVGLQQFDAEAANAVAEDLNSWRGRLTLKTIGLPIYVGHPDYDPEAYPDKRAYGRITAANVVANGLRLAVKWAKAGKELLEDGAFAFYSPFWGLVKTANIKRPGRLYSLGLTNSPNMAVPALVAANEKELPGSMEELGKTQTEEIGMKSLLEKLLELLGLGAETTEDAAVEAVKKMQSDLQAVSSDAAQMGKDAEAAKADATAANDRAAALAKSETAAKTALTAANEAVAAERKARAQVVVGQAVVQGKLKAAEMESAVNEFVADPDATAAKLARMTPRLKTKTAIDPATRQAQQDASQAYLAAVNERMTKAGEDYDTAWANVRNTPEGAALHSRMETPAIG